MHINLQKHIHMHVDLYSRWHSSRKQAAVIIHGPLLLVPEEVERTSRKHVASHRQIACIGCGVPGLGSAVPI